MPTDPDHTDHTARYHVNLVHDFLGPRRVVDVYHASCTDDDCTRQHVHVIDAADFERLYVDRPRFHDHDNDRTGYAHDHDGRSIVHYHHGTSVQYVAGDKVIPRPTDPA